MQTSTMAQTLRQPGELANEPCANHWTTIINILDRQDRHIADLQTAMLEQAQTITRLQRQLQGHLKLIIER
jgi:hypothetical protein